MNLPAWFRTPYAHALGWMLVHSLWEIALLGALVALALSALRRRSANARYLVCCGTLLLMLAVPTATYVHLLPPATSRAAETEHAAQNAVPMPALEGPKDNAPQGAPPLAMPAMASASIGHTVEDYLPAAVLIYLAGTAFLALRLAAGYWRLRMLVARAHAAAGATQAILDALARRLAMSKPVRLLESAAVEVPTLIGALRPVILFPATALTGLSPAQLEAILAHELAHIRRHDYIINLIQCIAETVLFYHPAVWWVSARIRQEREHCCDDAAMVLTGDRVLYARALARMESLRAAPPGVPASVALAASGGVLLPRIQRILGARRPAARTAPLAGVMLLAAFVSGIIYVGCTLNRGNTTAAPGPDEAPLTLEARWILVPDSFLDDFRIGWDTYIMATAAARPDVAESRMPASVIDDWTLNILLQTTKSDPRTFTYSLPAVRTKDFTDIRFFRNTPDARERPAATQRAAPPASFALSFGVLPRLSLDRRSVELDVHDLATSGEPARRETGLADGNAIEMIPNGTLSVPDGGTMLVNVGAVADAAQKYHCLLLLRPTITRPTGPRYVAADGSITTQPSAATKPVGDMTVLVYDVRDLISVRQQRTHTPQRPESLEAMWRDQRDAAAGTTGFGATAPATIPATTMPLGYKQIMASLMAEIAGSVAPGSWQGHGGAGTMREFNGQLIVSQTPAHQKAVYAFIMKQRDAYAVRTTLELKLLLVSDATLKSFALPKPADIQSSAGTGPKTLAISTLDARQLPALYKAADAAADTSSLTAPRVTLYDGLPGYISETNQQNIVSAVHSHKDDKGQPAADLEIKTISSGAMVYLRASVAADRKSVTLALHPSILALDRIDTVNVPEAGTLFDSGAPAFYQKPVTRGTEFAVEARVDDGQAIVITGDKYTGNFPVPDRMNVGGWNLSPPLPNAGERNLVLVARPQITVQNYNDLFQKSMDDVVRQGPGLP